MRALPLLIALAALPAGPLMAANSLVIDANQRETLSLTLYNQNLALVRETRHLPPLPAGEPVTIDDVSPQLQPDSLRIRNAGTILEQNFNSRLLSRYALLQQFIDKPLTLARTNPATGEEVEIEATLLSVEGDQALIARAGRIETIPLNDQWRFIFPTRPDSLQTRPSLTFRSAGTRAPQQAQISYLTGGLSWQMNYLLMLDDNTDRATLSGMATLLNQSGSRYPDARIQLMAGAVSQPAQAGRPLMKAAPMELMAAADASMGAPVQMEAFHLYPLPGSIDLEDGQQKQVSLMTGEQVPVERLYLHEFYVSPQQDPQKHRIKPAMRLRFENDEKTGLGQPMPAGSLRVFRPDDTGAVQFVGGDNLSHTAPGETVEIDLGQAFDLTIERRQTQFTKTYDGYLVAHELRISNPRTQPANLVLRANFSQEWELKNSSQPAQTRSAGSAEWTVKVPGRGDIPLNFTVLLKARR